MGRSIHYCECGEEIHDEMEQCIPCWNRANKAARRAGDDSLERAARGECPDCKQPLSGDEGLDREVHGRCQSQGKPIHGWFEIREPEGAADLEKLARDKVWELDSRLDLGLTPDEERIATEIILAALQRAVAECAKRAVDIATQLAAAKELLREVRPFANLVNSNRAEDLRDKIDAFLNPQNDEPEIH